MNIGILGFGVVGKSALHFFSTYYKNSRVSVWDKRLLSQEEQKLLALHNATHVTQPLSKFLQTQDMILISPGVKLDNFSGHILCELDLFSKHFLKKSIAITGTLGKTTVTKMLSQLLSILQVKNVCGGNIGVGMLDMLSKQADIDVAVLELSSFQLERSKRFAPHIAVMTNFFPNHLDRHKNLDQYFEAKWNLFVYQTSHDFALLPAQMLGMEQFLCKIKQIKSPLCLYNSKDVTQTLRDIKRLNLNVHTLFFLEDRKLYVLQKPFTQKKQLCNVSLFPDMTFEENWGIVLATLFLYGCEVKRLEMMMRESNPQTVMVQEHRLEKCAVINGIDFYNDSKSTIMQATYAAVQKIDQQERPIILLLGGLSKGVDRTHVKKRLESFKNIKQVCCFGTHVSDFRPFTRYTSLEHALNAIMQIAKPGDIVLFSPGGASFDLFDNYMHRGNVFKDIVWKLQKTN